MEVEDCFILNYRKKLKIANVDLAILEGNERAELVSSYKTHFINRYTIIVYDLKAGEFRFKYDTF